MNRSSPAPAVLAVLVCLQLLACGGSSSTDDGGSTASADAGASTDGGTETVDAGSTEDAGTTVDAGLDGGTDAGPLDDGGFGPPGGDGGFGPPGGDGASDAGSIGSVGTLATDAGIACAALGTQQARVACAANAVLATLTTSELAGVSFSLTDYVTRSKWNNLPVAARPRAGTELGSLSAGAQAATLDLMTLALGEIGSTTLNGILRADDYLATMAGGGYGSTLYSVAIFGTPSDTGNFEVMFGGHHLSYNLNFVGGGFYPVPQHLGAEPKAAFTFDGGTYAPMAPKGDALFAIYESLTSGEKATAYLSGQTFSDVVVAPDLDYGLGASRKSPSAYPTGANRTGVLVSSLASAQQALVVAAIEQWVRQYPAEVADQLMADYTAGFSDTYFAWGGATSGADRDVTGSYLRLDGPRLWIELTVQGGIVIRNVTHYHTIFHDKTKDYGGEF